MQITIHGFSHDGRGIGRVQEAGKRFGKTCFVEGALPDEVVDVVVVKENRRMIEAELEYIEQASSGRVEPACAYYQQCGGCQLQHASIGLQRQLKQDVLSQQFQRLGQIEPVELEPNLVSEPWHSRRRVRFSVKGETLGFKARRSNKIVDVKACLIADERINQQLPSIKKLLPLLKQVDGLEVIANQPLLVAVQAKQTPNVSQALSDYCQAQSLSLWYRNTHIAGPEASLSYQIDGVQYHYQSQHFSQVNSSINEQMVAQAIAWAKPSSSDTVIDLFCGIGNFALAFAKHAKQVIGIEGSKASIEQAMQNAELNGLSNCQFNVQDLFKPQGDWLNAPANIVVLDPPRAGAEQAIDAFSWQGKERIVYVSCDPATLARDAKLLGSKGFALQQLVMMDMFPQTRHIEAMALFAAK